MTIAGALLICLTTGQLRVPSAILLRIIPDFFPGKALAGTGNILLLSENDKGKRIYIDFDGAMAYAKVWLNGKYVGEWPYGYTSFRLDLTPYINYRKRKYYCRKARYKKLGFKMVSGCRNLPECLACKNHHSFIWHIMVFSAQLLKLKKREAC